MDEIEKDSPKRFEREDAEKILQRAALLDDTRIDEIELRAVALEVGISKEALESAIALQRTGVGGPDGRNEWVNSAIGGGIGITSGVLAQYCQQFFVYDGGAVVMLGTIAALEVCAIVLAAKTDAKKRHRTFQMSNLTMWLSYGMGWTLSRGGYSSDLPSLLGSYGSIAALAGATTIAIRNRWDRFSGAWRVLTGVADAKPKEELVERIHRGAEQFKTLVRTAEMIR